MKRLGEPRTVRAKNALGHDCTTIHTDYELEERDVGTVREHHGGFQHARYKFSSSDVGRKITVYTDGTGWTCWMFNS